MSFIRLGLSSLRTTQRASQKLALSNQLFSRYQQIHTTNAAKVTIPFLKQIPQPPGYIVGSVNDAYVAPPPSKSHGSLHWTVERAISVALVPFLTIPFITGSYAPVLDATLSGLILVHSYIGFQSCIIDYIPARVYGKAYDYALYLLTFGSFVAAYGVYLIESNDVGLTGLVARIWSSPAPANKEEKK